MKRIIIYGTLIFVFSVFTGYMYSVLWKNKTKVENMSYNTNKTFKNEIKQTSVEVKEKIAYNAKFSLKKHYNVCGHTKIDNGELPIEFINLTKEEIECNYSDWKVEEFNHDSINLSKQFSGICEEHFRLKLSENTVDVFNIGNDGKEIFLNSTDISKEYLTSEDLEKLEEGIEVYGVADLNSAIEDFE